MDSLGGGATSSVEIPPEILGKAYENLDRAQGVQNYNPIPWMGGAVAAINPMQQAGMQSAMDAGNAFGLAGPMDVSSMLPESQEFAGGIQAYSAYPMFEQAMAAARQAYPDQMSLFDRFNAPTSTPVGGAANYGDMLPSAGTAAGVTMDAPQPFTPAPQPSAPVTPPAPQPSAPVATPPQGSGGLLGNVAPSVTPQGTYGGMPQPTQQDTTYGGQVGSGNVGGIPSLGEGWSYTAGNKKNEDFLKDVENGKVNFEAVRFYSPNVEQARKDAERYFVDELGMFDSRAAMDNYLHVVPSENNTFRFEYDSGGFWKKAQNFSLGKGFQAGNSTANYQNVQANQFGSGASNPYLTGSGDSAAGYNPYLDGLAGGYTGQQAAQPQVTQPPVSEPPIPPVDYNQYMNTPLDMSVATPQVQTKNPRLSGAAIKRRARLASR